MKYEPNTADPTIDEARARMMTQFRASGDRTAGIVGGVFFVVGLGLLTGGVFSARSQYNILKNWPKVDATMAKSAVTSGRDDKNTTVNGKEYLTPATSSYKSSSYVEMKRKVDAFAPGTQHGLLYDPADPSDIRYDAGYNFSFFLLPTILGGVGIVFAGVGAGVWFVFPSGGRDFCAHRATCRSREANPSALIARRPSLPTKPSTSCL
jgi:Protein of unknown function (DUF3592)